MDVDQHIASEFYIFTQFANGESEIELRFHCGSDCDEKSFKTIKNYLEIINGDH